MAAIQLALGTSKGRGAATTWAAAAALVLCGCWNPFAECASENRGVADGGSVGSVTPDAIISPHLGDHPGTLAWTAGSTTSVHLDIERTSTPVTALYDCDGRLEGFNVQVSGHLSTDDGTLDVTSSLIVGIDDTGKIRDESWDFSMNTSDGGTSEDFVSVPMTSLSPGDGVVRQSGSSGPVVGQLHFGP